MRSYPSRAESELAANRERSGLLFASANHYFATRYKPRNSLASQKASEQKQPQAMAISHPMVAKPSKISHAHGGMAAKLRQLAIATVIVSLLTRLVERAD